MRKSSRRNAGFSEHATVAVALVLCVSCAPRNVSPAHEADACARLDTFLTGAFPRPQTMRGRATFDVDSYRVRGRFELRLLAEGGAVLEFGGTTLLGGQREDVVVSLFGDTLRVLDRERGRYYEGDEVGEMVAGGTRVHGDWTMGLARALAVGCPGVESVQAGEHGLSGKGPDGPFDLRSEAGRLTSATWPNPAPSETFRDRLEVRYHWRNGALQQVEVRLPARGWRIRLEAG